MEGLDCHPGKVRTPDNDRMATWYERAFLQRFRISFVFIDIFREKGEEYLFSPFGDWKRFICNF